MNMKNENLFKIIGILSPLFVTCSLLAAQWGSVNTKMEVFESGLDKMIEQIDKKDQRTAEAIEKTNNAISELKQDMAYIKGELKR